MKLNDDYTGLQEHCQVQEWRHSCRKWRQRQGSWWRRRRNDDVMHVIWRIWRQAGPRSRDVCHMQHYVICDLRFVDRSSNLETQKQTNFWWAMVKNKQNQIEKLKNMTWKYDRMAHNTYLYAAIKLRDQNQLTDYECDIPSKFKI